MALSVTFGLDLPPRRDASPDFTADPIPASGLLTADEQRHRELLAALAEIGFAVEQIDIPEATPVAPPSAGPDLVLGAALLRDALSEALAQSQQLTASALEQVVERLRVLSRQVAASASGPSGWGSGLTINNDTSNPVPVTFGGPLQAQILDAGNTTTRTSADGATQYVGAWTATRSIGVQRCLVVLASTVTSGLGGTFEFQFSEDGTNPTVDETRTITSFSSVRDFDLENVGAYFRVKFTPSRALVGTEKVFITTQYATQDPGRFVRLANQQVEMQNAALPQNLTFLQGFDENGLSQNIQALLASDAIDPTDYGILVKSIDVGRQPDGDYVNAKADGTVFTTTTALGSSATFTSGWFDSDGWRSIEIAVKTNQVSAANGVLIEFTDDAQAGTPTVRTSRIYTFGSEDVANGFMTVRFPVELDGFRVSYTNGGTAQGSFFMQCNVRVEIMELARAELESTLTSTSSAIMTRSGLFGREPGTGLYANATRTVPNASSQTGVHVGIVKHEVPTPIKPDTGITGSAGTVSSAAKIIDTTAVPAGATSVEIQAQKGNNQLLLFATSAANATSSNAFFELDAGQSRFMSIGTGLTTDIWCAAAAGTQGYRINWTFGGAS